MGVKLISKKPAGGAGNFYYVYLCTCNNGNKKNVSVTSANDTQAEALALQECAIECDERKSIVLENLEIPIKEFSSEIENIENFKNEPITDSRTYINYSFYDQVYKSGDRLYGNWSQSLSGVCSGSTVNGFFYNIQIVKSPEIYGDCSGRYIVKIETID